MKVISSRVGVACALVIVCGALGPGLAAQAQTVPPPVTPTVLPPSPAPQAKSTEAPARTAYVLGPDDQLIIYAADVPDITGKTQRVDPGGDLRLPLVGRIHAAGLTVEQLEAELTKRLKVYLEQPDVSVTMTAFQSQPVSVVGAVRSPGVQQVGGNKTLIEVLSMAGGLSDEAGPTVRISRHKESGPIPLPEAVTDSTGNFSMVDIDARALLNATSVDKNIAIMANDVISVPRAQLVYVLGEVSKPGSVPLVTGDSMSVMQAVSATGGVLKTSKPANASIRRVVPGQTIAAMIPVDIQKIMQGKSPDLALHAGDILVVPDATGKNATIKILGAAIQTGLSVAMYGIIW